MKLDSHPDQNTERVVSGKNSEIKFTYECNTSCVFLKSLWLVLYS